MKPFSLLIKPASALCNIDCTYCFYKRVLGVYPETEYQLKMSLSTAEALVEKFLGLKFPAVSLCFQGGEPLLMGLDFYRQIIEMEKKHGFPGQAVGNSFQTNAVLVNEEWAAFFRQYNMLLGVSLDGEEDLHDYYRKDYSGSGTFKKVMQGIRHLEAGNVEFNILSMLTPASAPRAVNTYKFLRSLGFNYLQFIPCLEEIPGAGKPAPFSLSSDDFLLFYKKLFDTWYENGYPHVSVRLFDDILSYILDGHRNSCAFQNACNSYFLVEHNGDVYPCDFFVYPEWKLGSIVNNSFDEIVKSDKRLKFAKLKSMAGRHCRECKYYTFCLGDCTKFRLFGGNNESHISALCPGFRDFLDYSFPRFLELSEDIKKRRLSRRMQSPPPVIPADYPRNAPCLCGSGRKYKHCCMQSENKS
ncbi:MAG: anaerobic sulfatase maturase [Spirochaetes bacterium GWF1_41_5]|nr:MAG: anaerobic sulfatase maturase [Spirochaetes bacterium GWF1_41_5]HBE04022.1 anaerobic sulfatase maturase [Spirochaetia bacterium]